MWTGVEFQSEATEVDDLMHKLANEMQAKKNTSDWRKDLRCSTMTEFQQEEEKVVGKLKGKRKQFRRKECKRFDARS